MAVPTGWLAAGGGSGSLQAGVLLPEPAEGYYYEPEVPPVVPPLPDAFAATFLSNGGGSAFGASDNATVSRVTLQRTTVYGALLIDSFTIPALGSIVLCPRPTGGPLELCDRPALTTFSACPRPVNP